jgi:hypothetical protein
MDVVYALLGLAFFAVSYAFVELIMRLWEGSYALGLRPRWCDHGRSARVPAHRAALCYTFGKMVGDVRQGWVA